MLNTTINTAVVSSPYLDINIWFFITMIGLLLLAASNLTTADQNSGLWALLCPFFLFPSAYFSLHLCTTTITQSISSTGQAYVAINQTVFHPEWLALVMGIVFIISIINIWHVLTKNPIEKAEQDRF